MDTVWAQNVSLLEISREFVDRYRRQQQVQGGVPEVARPAGPARVGQLVGVAGMVGIAGLVRVFGVAGLSSSSTLVFLLSLKIATPVWGSTIPPPPTSCTLGQPTAARILTTKAATNLASMKAFRFGPFGPGSMCQFYTTLGDPRGSQMPSKGSTCHHISASILHPLLATPPTILRDLDRTRVPATGARQVWWGGGGLRPRATLPKEGGNSADPESNGAPEYQAAVPSHLTEPHPRSAHPPTLSHFHHAQLVPC